MTTTFERCGASRSQPATGKRGAAAFVVGDLYAPATGASFGASAPAPDCAAGGGQGSPKTSVPGDLSAALGPKDLSPAELAPLIRGDARSCDGAAFLLARRLGLSDAAGSRRFPKRGRWPARPATALEPDAHDRTTHPQLP